MISGSKADLAIKIFGQDMEVLKEKAAEVEAVIRTVPGAADVQKDQVTGTPQLRITVDRQAIARYGINVEDVQGIIRTAVGGEKAGQIFEGIPRFDIVVRYADGSRSSVEAIGRDPGGGAGRAEGAAVRAGEDRGNRGSPADHPGEQPALHHGAVQRARPGHRLVRRGTARRRSRQKVKLPPGYLVSWGGQFKLQQEANKRLALVVPVTLLIVFLLLFSRSTR